MEWLFSGVEACTGFYREVVTVTHFELFSFLIIFVGLTAVSVYVLLDVLTEPKSNRLALLAVMVLLGVLTYKVFMPLSEYYVEIPFFTQFDCTFNTLVFPAGFNENIDLLFVYGRLVSLLIIPLFVVTVLVRLVWKIGTTVYKRIEAA